MEKRYRNYENGLIKSLKNSIEVKAYLKEAYKESNSMKLLAIKDIVVSQSEMFDALIEGLKEVLDHVQGKMQLIEEITEVDDEKRSS